LIFAQNQTKNTPTSALRYALKSRAFQLFLGLLCMFASVENLVFLACAQGVRIFFASAFIRVEEAEL
jgi:hypothetical protein